MNIDIERLKVDESLWPEGATHFIGGLFRKWDAGQEFIAYSNGDWADSACSWSLRTHRESRDNDGIIPRPEPQQEEWDEEGLPVVGLECECSVIDQPFRRFQVRGYFQEMVWLSGDGVGEIVERVTDCQFRPIRTKEQREREDLADLCRSVIGEQDMGKVADAIIAAGWRKPAGGVKRTDVIDTIASSKVDLDGCDRVDIADAILAHYNLEPKQ